MTELIDKMKLLEQIAEFGREIPKDQVIGVIARQEAVETDGDLISRADAIEAMKAVSDSICEQQAVDAIEALPTSDRPKGEWIPCAERMPSEKKAVLISDSGGNRFVGKLVLTDHGYKWSVPLFKISKAWVDIEDGDAWMPLPEPYKGGESK